MSKLVVIENPDIPDERIGNKATVANWFGVSLTTVDQWIRRGVPYLQRGERGKEWRFDLLAIARWKYGAPEATPDDDPEKLSPKDRLDWYRGARERTKHMQEMGELIPAAEFERVLSETVKPIATGLESLPDLLERDAGIDGAAVERVIVVVDRLRESIYAKVAGA